MAGFYQRQQRSQYHLRDTRQQALRRHAWHGGGERVGLCLMALLALTSLLLISGCGGDNGDNTERVDLTNVRIADRQSVFDILENRTFEFTTDGGGTGVFGGVKNGTISFGAVTIDANGVPHAPFTMKDADNPDPADPAKDSEGEGDSDGGASCNFHFATSTLSNIAAGQVVKCGLCDTLVSAAGVPLGGSANGQLIWVLNGARDANNTVAFQSLAINITAGVDSTGKLITVDGVPVTAEPTP